MINEWKAFFERHREGVLGTVIFHLLLLIVLVSVGISREKERQVMEVVMDLPTEEETEQARAERERKEEMEQRTTEGEVERMLRSLAVNEEESRETSMAEGNERERVEEYIRELERELEEGRKARGETDKGKGEMALARGEREADSLAYERTRRERELDSLRSTVYAGRSSVTYRLEGRHKVVLPIPVFKCEFGGRVVVAVTVSKFTNADNMGFGIQADNLQKVLDSVGDIDRNTFHVQCGSCEELLSEEEEYCPSCGEKLPEGIFEERSISPIAQFCEEAIAQLGINPVLAREATDAWVFHNGSSEIRLFVYDNDYLFTTSPIVLLPKKNVEDVLTFMLSTDFGPYKLGVDGKQIYIAYRIHLSDINDDTAAEIQQNIVNIARKADELDNYMVERFGCEFSEYSKTDNEAK